MKLIIIPCTCLIGPRYIAAAIYYKLRMPHEYIFSVLLNIVAVVVVQDPHEIVSLWSFPSLLMAYVALFFLDGPTFANGKYLRIQQPFHHTSIYSAPHQDEVVYLRQDVTQYSAQAVTASSTSLQQNIIICHYHNREDALYAKNLKTQLGIFEQQGTVELWDESKIQAGAHRERAINQAIAAASVIVLLVSADFLNSDFKLLHKVLRHAANHQHVWIYPVILSSCLYDESDLSEFQPYYSESANPHHKPLAELSVPKRTETLRDLARAIGKRLALSKTN